jgi:ADP-ribosylglycohydrolase
MKEVTEPGAITYEDRVRGALWGGLVGDAFCLGSHWIYSPNELMSKYPTGIDGFDEPVAGHYHYGKKSGDFTHYGDVALLMLASIAHCGKLQVSDFGTRFVKRLIIDDYSGYRDHAIKGTITNYLNHQKTSPNEPFDFQQGADDDQPLTISHIAPVVVAHMNTVDLLETVASATRICQNNSRAVTFTQAGALILNSLLNGNSPETAVIETRKKVGTTDKFINEVNKRMKIACAAHMLPPTEATMLFGQSCPLYSSFTAALHTTLACSNNFTQAIRATAEAGGDNAGRAAMVGAWLGAHLGIQAIPEAWRTKLSYHGEVAAHVEKIVAGLTVAVNDSGD